MAGVNEPDNVVGASALSRDDQIDTHLREALKKMLKELVDKCILEWTQHHPSLRGVEVPGLGFTWRFLNPYRGFPTPISFTQGGPIPEELPTWKRRDIASCIQALVTGDIKIDISQRILLSQRPTIAQVLSAQRKESMANPHTDPMAVAAVVNPGTANLPVAPPPASGSQRFPTWTVTPSIAANDRAPTIRNGSTKGDLNAMVYNLLNAANTILSQSLKTQKESERHREQLAVQLEGAREYFGNLSFESSASRERERHEQVLKERLDAADQKSQDLEVENARHKTKIEKLQEELKDARAPRTHRATMNKMRCSMTIKQHIKALPKPPNSSFPQPMLAFLISFVQSHVGGDYSLVTSVKCATQAKVEWQQIHVDPVYHEECPTRYSGNGALTHIEGGPIVGEIDQIYALWRVEREGFTKYIGHYKIMKRIVTPHTVSDIRESQMKAIVKDLLSHSWGYDLLLSKGVAMGSDETEQARYDSIKGLFESENEPRLRVVWSTLQFESFEFEDYNKLLTIAHLPRCRREEPVDAKSGSDDELPSSQRGMKASLSLTSRKRPEPHDEDHPSNNDLDGRRVRTARVSGVVKREAEEETPDAMDIYEDSNCSPASKGSGPVEDITEEVLNSQYVSESQNFAEFEDVSTS